MDDERATHGFESFGEYMRIKQEKLRKQNSSDYLETTSLFQGMTFYINDKTAIPIQEFKQMIIENGGRIEIYPGTKVTHVLTNHIPRNKYEKLKKFIILKPTWIEDCVREGRILDSSAYLVRPENKMPSSKSENKEVLQLKETPDSIVEFWEQKDEEDNTLGNSRIIDCNSPDFLENYFAHSRLHHISIWRQELEDFADELMKGKNMVISESTESKLFHVDLDCFFASVSTRDKPEWQGRPVAVCHANSSEDRRDLHNSTSEIASCNYVARKYGVKNGMFVQKAILLCPNLGILPYEFDKYYKVSFDFYRVLSKYASLLKPLSCDEALISISSVQEDLVKMASRLKQDILEACGINASVGIADNSFLAKLACKRAKPNGIFSLQMNTAMDFISELSLTELPGVGPSIASKLENCGFSSVTQVRTLSLKEIQSILGEQNGRAVYEKVRGIDQTDPFMTKERKTVGAEVNWAIRFTTKDQVNAFIRRLSDNVYNRMVNLCLYGDKIQFSLLQKRPGSSNPRKFLGCGICDTYSKSRQLSATVPSSEVLASECIALYSHMNIPCDEIRGVGIHIANLKRKPSQSKNLCSFMGGSAISTDTRSIFERYGIDEAILNELPLNIQASIMEEIEANEKRFGEHVETKPRESPTKQSIVSSVSIHKLKQTDLIFRSAVGADYIIKYLKECEKLDKDTFQEIICELRLSLKSQFSQVGMKQSVDTLCRRIEREWPTIGKILP